MSKKRNNGVRFALIKAIEQLRVFFPENVGVVGSDSVKAVIDVV